MIVHVNRLKCCFFRTITENAQNYDTRVTIAGMQTQLAGEADASHGVNVSHRQAIATNHQQGLAEVP